MFIPASKQHFSGLSGNGILKFRKSESEIQNSQFPNRINEKARLGIQSGTLSSSKDEPSFYIQLAACVLLPSPSLAVSETL